MTGGMGVHKNVHIEEWVAKRENLEQFFKFTKGAFARFAFFGIAVPYGAYRAIIYELVRSFLKSCEPAKCLHSALDDHGFMAFLS